MPPATSNDSSASSPYPRDALFDIETLINVAQPQSILLLGDHSADFLQAYVDSRALINQPCDVTCICSSELAQFAELEQRFDIAVVLNLFEHIDKREGSQILSRLRDVLAPQYCICLPLDGSEANAWQLTDLFAFALTRVAAYQQEELRYGLFKYHINSYKKTPDWLNADNWANPQMWGKYWW